MTPFAVRDECARRFTVLFAADAAEIVGEAVEIRYQGVLFDIANTPLKPVDPSRYWVRFSMRGVMSRQSAFVMSPEPDGEEPTEYETNGLLFVQVFAPMSKVDGFARGDLLARLAQSIFRGAETPSGVVFRNVRVNELEDDTKAFRWNVIAEYEFSEVG